jgi:ubiquinone/menaquinone biosynthesis C-methylase UbiE
MTDAIRSSFDGIADAYAGEFADELERKPFDRDLLVQFASTLPPGAKALDVGTGAAGHIGRFLADRGLTVTGIDLSTRAIEIARTLNPTMDFVVADFRALPLGDASVDAVVGFYCFIYGTEDDIVAGLAEAARVLRSGGRLLASVHGALDDRPRDETFTDFQGTPVDITMRYTTPAALATLAERAGLRIDELRVREPYESEHKSRRIYLLASAP